MSSAAICSRSNSVDWVGSVPEEREPSRVQNRAGGEGAGELVAAAGQVQRVREAHPVQSALDGGARGVHVEVAVDVEQSAPLAEGGIEAGQQPHGDRAVATEHEQATVVGHQPRDVVGQFLDRGHDLTDVLREPVVPIGRPHLSGEVPGVVDVDAGAGECLDEPRVAEGARRLVLACGVAPGTARHADHRESAHDEGKSRTAGACTGAVKVTGAWTARWRRSRPWRRRRRRAPPPRPRDRRPGRCPRRRPMCRGCSRC